VAELKAQPGGDLGIIGSVTTTKGVIIAHYARR
jgi:hypothetical protein